MSKHNRKKILYIITQGAWGGAQRYIFDLTTNLNKNFDIIVAVGEPRGKLDLQSKLKTQNSKLKTIQLTHLVRKISPIKDVLAIFELKKLYEDVNPDIVHLNSSKAGIIGSLVKIVSRNFQARVVYTAHGWVFNEPLSWFRKNLYLFLEKFTAKFKDKIIVLSKQDKHTLTDILNAKEEKVSLISLGINLPQKTLSKEKSREKLLNKIPNSKHPTKNDIWIGTVAGLYRTKGIDTLIESIKLFNSHPATKNYQFLIIGDGPEKDKSLSLINSYDLENVHLLGFIDSVTQFLPAFDLFVLPSRKEGLPYVLLEAIACNIPIIATDVGGISSLIENKKTGILIEPNNCEILTRELVKSIENRSELQKYADEASKKIEEISLKKMLMETKEVYSSLLS